MELHTNGLCFRYTSELIWRMAWVRLLTSSTTGASLVTASSQWWCCWISLSTEVTTDFGKGKYSKGVISSVGINMFYLAFSVTHISALSKILYLLCMARRTPSGISGSPVGIFFLYIVANLRRRLSIVLCWWEKRLLCSLKTVYHSSRHKGIYVYIMDSK